VCGGLVTGVLAGLWLAVVEIVWVLLFGAGAAGHAGRFALVVALLAMCCGGVFGALAGLVAWGAGRLGALLGKRRVNELTATARVYAILLTVPVALVCANLFSGRWARTIPLHDGLAVVVGLLLLYGGFRVAQLVLTLRDRLRRGSLPARSGSLLGFALLGVALFLYVADQRLFPRLYVYLHNALAFTAYLSALLGLGALFAARQASGSRLGRLAEPGIALCVAVAVVGGGTTGLAVLSRSQGLRFVVAEHTAVGQKLAGMAAALHIGPRRGLAPLPSSLPAPHGSTLHAPKLPVGLRVPGADVFLISVDACRADHVGAYGYPRRTTPAIDEVASSGAVFERAYAQVPHTSFSISTMLTGKYLYSLAELGDRQRHETLPVILRRYGYKTAGFFPPSVFFIDAQKFTTYEETRFHFEYVKYEYLDAAGRVDQIIQFLESEKPARVFTWAHFFEPHEPYDPHPGFDFGARAIDRYDGEIAYVDAQIGRLVRWIRANRPNAVVIVTADHGEEFGEHGGHYHATTLYDEQIRVPLVMSAPGLTARRVPIQAEIVDVPTTILALLDLPLPARMRGTDLTPWLADPPADPDAAPPAFGEIERKKMVVRQNHKLICDLQQGFCELYDLVADPHEKRNLADADKQEVATLRSELDAWIGGHLAYEQGPPELEGPQRRRHALERGRLGDVGAVPELQRLLGDGDVAVRREAARLLLQLRAPVARQALTQALGDADVEVRRAAQAGAAPLVPAARAAAKGLLADEQAPADARLWAAIGLADANDPAGVPLLARAVASSCQIIADGSNADGRCVGQIDPILARDVVLLLGQLKDRRAVPALLEARGNVRLRKEVVQALGEIGDPRVATPLWRELLVEPRIEVRGEIARALGKLGDRTAVPALARAFGRETEASVARELFLALCALKGVSAGGAQAADLTRRPPAASVAVALVPPRGEPAGRFDLWVKVTAAARARLSLRVGERVVGQVEVGPAEQVVSAPLPADAMPKRGPLHLTLHVDEGTPHVEAAWLRALPGGPAPASAPASGPAKAPASSPTP
jgi:arylsulfatase A-like enzyme/HEAT repeat protein